MENVRPGVKRTMDVSVEREITFIEGWVYVIGTHVLHALVFWIIVSKTLLPWIHEAVWYCDFMR
eukprot:2856965-Karenia_brevis.AAC.1